MSSFPEFLFKFLKIEKFRSLNKPNLISFWFSGFNFSNYVAFMQAMVHFNLVDGLWETIGFFLILIIATLLINILLLRYHPIKFLLITGCLFWATGIFLLVYPIYIRL